MGHGLCGSGKDEAVSGNAGPLGPAFLLTARVLSRA